MRIDCQYNVCMYVVKPINFLGLRNASIGNFGNFSFRCWEEKYSRDERFGLSLYSSLLSKGTSGIFSAREGSRFTKGLLNSSAMLLRLINDVILLLKVSGGDTLGDHLLLAKCPYHLYYGMLYIRAFLQLV